MEEHAQAAGVRVSGEEVVRDAVGKLACLLGFDMAAVAQHIDAMAESLRRIHSEGGGTRVILVSMSATSGNRIVPHSPEILKKEPVMRRKAG